MKKGVLLGLPVLMLLPLLVLLLGTGNASIESAACDDQQATMPTRPGGPAGSGTIAALNVLAARHTGPGGKNASRRDGPARMRELMRRLNAENVTVAALQEFDKPMKRVLDSTAGWASTATTSNWSAVAYRTDTWTLVSTEVLTTPVGHRRLGQMIATLQDREGNTITVMSVHNPVGFGSRGLPNRKADRIVSERLERKKASTIPGAVIVAGDFNTSPARQRGVNMSPLVSAHDGRVADPATEYGPVDYIFGRGVAFDGFKKRRLGATDHPLLTAAFSPAGDAGSRGAGAPPAAAEAAGPGGAAQARIVTASGPTSTVRDALMRLRFTEDDPALTAEQARNAILIAQVARDLGVPRRGLQVAIATAIQESRLENLPDGDRDSAGLFQQRPSAGWGTREQITDPTLATRAFFGRADHTDNRGLLDVPGWQAMGIGQVVAAFQNPGTPHEDYEQWEPIAGSITDLVGADLPAVSTTGTGAAACLTPVNAGCAAPAGDYDLGPVTPQLERLVRVLAPMFDIETVGGYRPSATDPHGHPAGLAADFMVSDTPAGKAKGDALARYARAHATELGIDYIIWYQRIWSVDRAHEGWRPMADRGSRTDNHYDHPHINVLPDAAVDAAVGSAAGEGCGKVVHPVPGEYSDSDAHNWHDSGDYWSSWHTGTDFGAPCGTPVYAAHAGTIEVDTTESWSGPWLVKVTTGPRSLTTWYAHMQELSVARGTTVQPGQQIGVIGQEGNSSGCHLHFEVHLQNGSMYGPDNVDPSMWLAQNAPTQAA